MELTISNRVVLIDEEDYAKISKYEWQVANYGRGYLYAVSTFPDRSFVQMHRFILNLNRDDKIEVDHKDHNTLNNQKSNLRLATKSQQHMNQKIRSDNQVGYKGVSWRSPPNKYIVRITVDGKRIEVGRFDDKIEAAKAYDEAAIRYYGEFAYTNFPHLESGDDFMATLRDGYMPNWDR